MIVTMSSNDTMNDTSRNFTQIPNDLIYPLSVSLIIIVVISCLTIGCVLGNSLVILAVIHVKKLKTPSNYLIVSLAVSDWFVGLIVMPLSLMYTVIGKWPLGAEACSMWVTLDVLLCTASILNLMMISIDRYLVITRPFQYSQKRSAKLMIFYITLAWIVSLFISVTPMFVGWNTVFINGICMLNQQIGYQVYATFVAFYLPLGVMIALYGRIFIISSRISKAEAKNNPYVQASRLQNNNNEEASLKETPEKLTAETEVTVDSGDTETIINGHSSATTLPHSLLNHLNGNAKTYIKRRSRQFSMASLGKRFQNHKIKRNNNRQAIKTLGVIMGLFTACWLPFFVLAVYKPICVCEVPSWIDNLLLWLGYMNSCINPIIYARFNREFRAPFKEILCCRCHTINQSVRQTDYMYRYGG